MYYPPFLEIGSGKGGHLTLMFFNGYRINNGDMTGLTLLQKQAIIIMGKERMKWASENKAIPSITMGV